MSAHVQTPNGDIYTPQAGLLGLAALRQTLANARHGQAINISHYVQGDVWLAEALILDHGRGPNHGLHDLRDDVILFASQPVTFHVSQPNVRHVMSAGRLTMSGQITLDGGGVGGGVHTGAFPDSSYHYGVFNSGMGNNHIIFATGARQGEGWHDTHFDPWRSGGALAGQAFVPGYYEVLIRFRWQHWTQADAYRDYRIETRWINAPGESQQTPVGPRPMDYFLLPNAHPSISFNSPMITSGITIQNTFSTVGANAIHSFGTVGLHRGTVITNSGTAGHSAARTTLYFKSGAKGSSSVTNFSFSQSAQLPIEAQGTLGAGANIAIASGNPVAVYGGTIITGAEPDPDLATPPPISQTQTPEHDIFIRHYWYEHEDIDGKYPGTLNRDDYSYRTGVEEGTTVSITEGNGGQMVFSPDALVPPGREGLSVVDVEFEIEGEMFNFSTLEEAMEESFEMPDHDVTLIIRWDTTETPTPTPTNNIYIRHYWDEYEDIDGKYPGTLNRNDYSYRTGVEEGTPVTITEGNGGQMTFSPDALVPYGRGGLGVVDVEFEIEGELFNFPTLEDAM